MAAVTAHERPEVRAALPGEGAEVAELWRELWEAHEGWGGYEATRDDRVYARLATRLDDDARVRGGQPILGRHIHLVASYRGRLAGQVEGWFDRHGTQMQTPFTCEVRSLIVRDGLRVAGVGRALLTTLAETSLELSRGSPSILAAEVLEPNPAHAFYAKLGYSPVSWSMRMHTAHVPRPGASAERYFARTAQPADAMAIAVLESLLAARRRDAHDLRFDRPRAVDATLASAIAAHLARPARDWTEPRELVAVDARGNVRASASLVVVPLDPPFTPTRRSILGRFAMDPARDPFPILAPLVALGCRLALASEAPTLELTDLTAPGTPLYEAARGLGAKPWSRVVTKNAT